MQLLAFYVMCVGCVPRCYIVANAFTLLSVAYCYVLLSMDCYVWLHIVTLLDLVVYVLYTALCCAYVYIDD